MRFTSFRGPFLSRRWLVMVAAGCLLFLQSVRGQERPPFRVSMLRLTTVDAGERAKMERAAALFEQVMNDTAFLRVLADTLYLFDLPADPMRNLTSRQIADTLYSGREWYRPVKDHVADVIWNCTKRKARPLFSTTIGYGNPTDSAINTYRFFVRNNRASAIAGHLAHEWSHKVGFAHQFHDHAQRDQTVSYLFGNLVARFARKYE